MTGEAGEGTALVTGRLEHGAVIASGDAHDTVVPVTFLEVFRVPLEPLPQPGLGGHEPRPDHRRALFEVIPRPVGRPLLVPVLGLGDPLDAVALAADLRRGARGHA